MKVQIGPQLKLDRCNHCGIARPVLTVMHHLVTFDAFGHNKRNWHLFGCSTCGGALLTESRDGSADVLRIWPDTPAIAEAIPERARKYLHQAVNSLASPDAAVMVNASALDAMLKEKGYTSGDLYSRINTAAKDGLITEDMAKWAHEVRLDANKPRHADIEDPHATTEDATRVIAFSLALAEFLFVLPQRVSERGASTAPLAPPLAG